MRQSPIRTSCFSLFMALGASALSFAAEVEMKTIHVDKFFAGQLAPLPLTWKIPKAYVHAEGLDVGETYSYWMLPSEVEAAATNNDLPTETGYIWGKISMDVAYVVEEKKFSHEADYKKQAEEMGWEFITERRRNVAGFAVIASTFAYKPEDAARRLVFSAYIATNIATNCIFLAYTAPTNLTEAEAQKTWDTIIDSIAKEPLP